MDYQKLENVSTHSQEVKWLGSPEHEKYQECWKIFYSRYHTPIVNYILKRANWGKNRIIDAEELASIVYEKGFRWSFKKQKSIRFRVILKRLVKDAISDYMRKKKPISQLPDYHEEIAATNNPSDSLSIEILQVAATRILQKYEGRRRDILEWVWQNSRWPKAEEMITIFNISGQTLEKNKQAVRQWHKRNRGLWEDFQDKLRNEISQLAMGEDIASEINHFENLELK